MQTLILYTGGTIGMHASAAGLVPASGFDTRLQAELNQRPDAPALSWRFRELSPPIDSANMSQAHWLLMRDAIVEAVEQDGCGAVLILHGTDTLAYTAAALSFLLLGLPIPVVLTGSMLPAGTPDSDAWANLFGALQRLADGAPAGVHLFFHDRLLLGTRVTKRSSEQFEAFAEALRPVVHPRPLSLPVPNFRTPRREVSLACLPLYPGLRAEHVQALIDTGLQALLLECYGSGTGPADNAGLLDVLRQAHHRGVVIAAISQCPEGRVDFGTYAAGNRLAACGVISGGGMTREAALAKLFALLGAGLEQRQVEALFAADLCGELTGACASH
jgi:L-asparaginase